MGTNVEDSALSQLMQWVKDDRKIAEKIYKLIQDIHRNGLAHGIGKPEHLKYHDGWSRRIDEANRLVYDVDKDGKLHILSCKGHFED